MGTYPSSGAEVGCIDIWYADGSWYEDGSSAVLSDGSSAIVVVRGQLLVRGRLIRRVRSLDNNQQPLSDWASVEFTLVIDKPTGIEDIHVTPFDAVRKVIHDGILYIIRPDG